MPDIYIKEVKWACLALGIHAKDSRVFTLLVTLPPGHRVKLQFSATLAVRYDHRTRAEVIQLCSGLDHQAAPT